MRRVLICTVGTSLKGNLTAKHGHAFEPGNQNIKEIVLELSGMDPGDRLNGAEINSISSIIDKGLLDSRDHLYFLVSDTEDGQKIGAILKAYVERRQNRLCFDKVELVVVEGLTDQSPRRFKTEGLKNLVKEIAKIVRRHGSPSVLINATGGYKAQISFAGMIGQALEIPVCYLFEKFSEVITLPPQPVSLDLGFWMENANLFYELAESDAKENPSGKDERFSSLVEEIEVDGEKAVGLSAIGQLFHETFIYRFQQNREELLPPDSGIRPEDKAIKFEDENSGRQRGLKGFLENLCRKPYVVRIFTHYFNPNLQLKSNFRPSAKGDLSRIEGCCTDGRATTKFDVVTTAKNKGQQNAVIADLLSLI